MPRVPIVMPQLGESIAEATIVSILVEPGEEVEADQEVIEVETQKATMGVTTLCGGTISSFTAEIGETYAVGTTLGHIEATEEEIQRTGAQVEGAEEAPAQEKPKPTPEKPSQEDEKPKVNTQYSGDQSSSVRPTVKGLPVPAKASGASYISPRIKARMEELSMNAADLAGIPGSGAAGRVTVEDFERYVEHLDSQRLTAASKMRIAVADSMRRSWSRPLATVGMPLRLEALLAHRKEQAPEAKAGPALYALRALGIALGENSAAAGRLVGSQIVHPPAIDIGFAVEVEDGVLVPVMRAVQDRSLADLVAEYIDLVELARSRRLPQEKSQAGIATVTNFGSFGITWATPIPLPEQNLVLGLGKGDRRPTWSAEKEAFLPSMEAEMTLSFDHRVTDGGAAGRLLLRVSELLQSPGDL
ncbi:MAG: 2-oxo acid dehydrogenase subunit E2 [Verrucomicrobiota bacterium]